MRTIAKLIKPKKEFHPQVKAEWGVWKFMQIYFSPNTMLVIDLRKIKTCSPLICIICPVCLVKGFSRRETFHSRSAKKLICHHCIVDFDRRIWLSVCLFAPLVVCFMYISLFSQANILPMSGSTAKKNQVKIFENWFCRRT